MAGFVTRLFSRSTNGRGKRKAAKAAAPAAPPVEEPAAAELLEVCRWGPEGGGAADLLMVLCHGMGSNGENIIQLAPKFGQLLPRALFVAPSGPEPAPRGGDGHAWFDARDRTPAVLAVGVRSAAAALDAVIDFELARAGLARDAYALAGYEPGGDDGAVRGAQARSGTAGDLLLCRGADRAGDAGGRAGEPGAGDAGARARGPGRAGFLFARRGAGAARGRGAGAGGLSAGVGAHHGRGGGSRPGRNSSAGGCCPRRLGHRQGPPRGRRRGGASSPMADAPALLDGPR